MALFGNLGGWKPQEKKSEAEYIPSRTFFTPQKKQTENTFNFDYPSQFVSQKLPSGIGTPVPTISSEVPSWTTPYTPGGGTVREPIPGGPGAYTEDPYSYEPGAGFGQGRSAAYDTYGRLAGLQGLTEDQIQRNISEREKAIRDIADLSMRDLRRSYQAAGAGAGSRYMSKGLESLGQQYASLMGQIPAEERARADALLRQDLTTAAGLGSDLYAKEQQASQEARRQGFNEYLERASDPRADIASRIDYLGKYMGDLRNQDPNAYARDPYTGAVSTVGEVLNKLMQEYQTAVNAISESNLGYGVPTQEGDIYTEPEPTPQPPALTPYVPTYTDTTPSGSNTNPLKATVKQNKQWQPGVAYKAFRQIQPPSSYSDWLF